MFVGFSLNGKVPKKREFKQFEPRFLSVQIGTSLWHFQWRVLAKCYENGQSKFSFGAEFHV